MACKAMQLLVTWPLLTSCLFCLLSRAITTSHNETRGTRTELSTIEPAIITMTTTATNGSQTTATDQVTSSAASYASMTTRKISTFKTSTNQPPVSKGIGKVHNEGTTHTAQTHTASTFDIGSFIGGMVLALSLTLVLFLGYKFFCSRQEIRYRTIEEHDAII
ncbi:hypothetical protein COCON_G00075960 [Conger conger]|uniref:Uncharacterized protein n=1 Tax=Conger conger TaxID=82655 RepID=A0A9Q1DNR5_CONCO|nr:hypothetical protein COCON_G00075960 [Conger conger]